MNDEAHQQRPDDGLPPPNRIEAPPEAIPYELAPEPPPAPRAARPSPTPGKLSDSGLTDDFPEDADFESDPEVDRALKGEPSADAAEDDTVDQEAKASRKPLVRPEGDPKNYALVGAGVAVAAMVVTAIRNSDHWFYGSLLALYMVALNTVTGVAAIGSVAYFEQARLGRIEHAAARMLVAVAIATVILSIGVGGYNVITAPLGIAAYLGMLAILFHWTPPRLIRVAAVHAAMIAALYFGMMLYAAAAGK